MKSAGRKTFTLLACPGYRTDQADQPASLASSRTRPGLEVPFCPAARRCTCTHLATDSRSEASRNTLPARRAVRTGHGDPQVYSSATFANPKISQLSGSQHTFSVHEQTGVQGGRPHQLDLRTTPLHQNSGHYQHIDRSSGSEGWEFESLRARNKKPLSRRYWSGASRCNGCTGPPPRKRQELATSYYVCWLTPNRTGKDRYGPASAGFRHRLRARPFDDDHSSSSRPRRIFSTTSSALIARLRRSTRPSRRCSLRSARYSRSSTVRGPSRSSVPEFAWVREPEFGVSGCAFAQ